MIHLRVPGALVRLVPGARPAAAKTDAENHCENAPHDIADGTILATDLLKETYASLMKMQNFGTKTMTEVKAAVVALGLKVPGSWKKPPRPVIKSQKRKKDDPFDGW